MRGAVGLLAFVAMLFGARFASAEESVTTFVTKPNAVRLVIGPFGSPTGGIGLEVERTLWSWLAVNGGFGAGGEGPQVAAGLRFRALQGDRWALGPAASLSYGKYTDFCLFKESCSGAAIGSVLWANVEMTCDFRFHSGFDLRFGLGASLDMACRGAQCQTPDGHQQHLGTRETLLPYTNVAIGYAW